MVRPRRASGFSFSYAALIVTLSGVFLAGAGGAPAPHVTAIGSIDWDAHLTLQIPKPAVTGSSFTIDPQWPAGFDASEVAGCRWEFRWGDNGSLDNNEFDETFGSLLFDVPDVAGDCAAWTFNLPWVPYPQYEVYVSGILFEADGGVVSFGDVHTRFKAAVSGTGRRITTSTLPLVQVLPDTYTPIVGESVTYTRYLVGGATAGTSSWNAWQGSGDNPNHWHQSGGSTFTITPWEPGNVLVGWDKVSGNWRLGATYDPPVRYRDLYRPNTTPPVQRIGAGVVATNLPVTLTWTGSDRGWGIDRFQVDRSVDSGAWKRVVAQKAKTLSQLLATGHTYRYRVRAIDKYGNIGYWDYGPTFRPNAYREGSTTIVYGGTWSTVADATARDGQLRESSTAGSGAKFAFIGRDVAWLAERGPGHGKAKIYINGVYATTIDLNASVDAPRRVVFRRHWSTRDSRTLRIVVEGTLGRPLVDVDGFLVLR